MKTKSAETQEATLDANKVFSFLKYTGHVYEIGLTGRDLDRAYGRSYNPRTIELFPEIKDYVGWSYDDGLYTAYAVRNGSASGAKMTFSNLKLNVETAKHVIELLLENL